MGLPTQTLNPQPTSSEPVIVFTPEKRGIDDVIGDEHLERRIDPVEQVRTVEEQEGRLREWRRRTAGEVGGGVIRNSGT
jgi:hypothetical protein